MAPPELGFCPGTGDGDGGRGEREGQGAEAEAEAAAAATILGAARCAARFYELKSQGIYARPCLQCIFYALQKKCICKRGRWLFINTHIYIIIFILKQTGGETCDLSFFRDVRARVEKKKKQGVWIYI